MRRMIFTWTELDKVGRIKILRSSYLFLFLVPILSRLFDRLCQDITYFFNSNFIIQDLLCHLEIPFTWQILYAASVLLSISTSIYAFCPSFIKQYPSYNIFIQSGLTGISCFNILKYDNMASEYYEYIIKTHLKENILTEIYSIDPTLHRKLLEIYTENQEYRIPSKDLIQQFLYLWCSKNPDEAYNFIMAYLNIKFYGFRVVSSICYICALLSTLYVFIENVFISFRIIFKTWG